MKTFLIILNTLGFAINIFIYFVTDKPLFINAFASGASFIALILLLCK